MPEEHHRVVGIRADGSRLVLVSGISKTTAEKVLAHVVAGIFAQIVIEVDSDESSSQGKRSVELFPPTPPGAPT